MAERFLDEIRGMCDFDGSGIIEEFGDWPPERFDSIREKLVSMILTLRGFSP